MSYVTSIIPGEEECLQEFEILKLCRSAQPPMPSAEKLPLWPIWPGGVERDETRIGRADLRFAAGDLVMGARLLRQSNLVGRLFTVAGAIRKN